MWKKLSKKKKASLFLVVFTVIIWFLAPVLTKNYINNNSKAIFGANAHISSLNFNYFTGSVNAKDFIIYDKNEVDTLFFTSKAHTNLNLYSYLKGNYIFEKINVDGLKLNLILNDTVLNLSTVVNHLFSPGKDKNSSQVVFENITIKNSSVSYNDRVLKSYASAINLNIQTLREFSANELILQLKTDFDLESGGEVNSEFIYDFKNTQYDIIFNSNEFNLSVLHPYLADLTFSKGSGGIQNSNIRASGFINSPIKTNLHGKFSLKEFFLKDSSNKEIASVKDLAVNIDSINLYREYFDLQKIKINKPCAKLTIDKYSDNFNRLIKYDSAVYAESSNSNIFIIAGEYIASLIKQIKVTNFSVDTLAITDVFIDFTDNKLTQPFVYSLFHGDINSTNINSDNDSIHVTMKAELQNKGKLSLSAVFSAVDPDDIYGNIKLFDVVASDFSPYSYEYFGLPLLQGKAFLNSQVNITNKQLDNSNRIRFFNLEFGKKERNPNIYRLPIKTAAQALKDENNETLLSFKISGDLSNPNYNILNVTGQVLVKLIEDAAKSPAKLFKKKND